MTKVFIASDHAGVLFKKQILDQLRSRLSGSYEFVDLGPATEASVDYPDYADKVAAPIARGEGIGILICGSGIGMSIRANRYQRVRAALCWDLASARLARQHNDANVLCLGARLIPVGLAAEATETFLNTKFDGGRHQGRIQKLDTKPLK
jgi:ribose 5-phosphate isomerase B